MSEEDVDGVDALIAHIASEPLAQEEWVERPRRVEAQKYVNLTSELANLLNRFSAENRSNTPDFILAEYLRGCLDLFDQTVRQREDWYGHRHEPARLDGPCVPSCNPKEVA